MKMDVYVGNRKALKEVFICLARNSPAHSIASV
jgi:hypothetical protein